MSMRAIYSTVQTFLLFLLRLSPEEKTSPHPSGLNIHVIMHSNLGRHLSCLLHIATELPQLAVNHSLGPLSRSPTPQRTMPPSDMLPMKLEWQQGNWNLTDARWQTEMADPFANGTEHTGHILQGGLWFQLIRSIINHVQDHCQLQICQKKQQQN